VRSCEVRGLEAGAHLVYEDAEGGAPAGLFAKAPKLCPGPRPRPRPWEERLPRPAPPAAAPAFPRAGSTCRAPSSPRPGMAGVGGLK
jgi:hypothetical protein